jgi:hypothetical protein
MSDQKNLFNGEYTKDPEWVKHWKDMPEYNNEYLSEALIEATFKFRSKEDFERFKNLVKKHIYNDERVFDGMQRKTKKSAWYPAKEKSSKYLYVDES